MPKLIRITTAPLSLKYLLAGQMHFMQQNGFDVIMVSSDGPEKEEVVAKEQCPLHVIPMTRSITPFADLVSLWRLYRFFKKEKPDIIHSHTPKAGLLSMLAARMAGTGIRVHTVAGLRFMTAKGMTRKLLVAMEKLTLSAANHVWPNSFSLKQYMLDQRLTDPAKTEVIGLGSSNGINLRRFSPSALDEHKLARIKELAGYDEQCIYFLSVGRIVHDKGIDELLKAFVAVYKKHDHIRLILVGSFEADLDPISEDAMRILQSHPGIIQAGWNDGVEYFMHFAFALLHASHREGFPNVLLQAGAMNCPVICSRIEGNIDIVEHGTTGLIFDVRNEQQLQSMMEAALNDPSAMKRYAGNLYNKVRNNFDQEIVHRQLYKKYQQLLAQRK